MATKDKSTKGENGTTTRFQNRLYRAEVGQTTAGSPILKLKATNPKGPFAQHRQLAAFIYELAADMERWSGDLRARWVISPDAMNGLVVVEITGDHEKALADEFVASVIAGNGLG